MALAAVILLHLGVFMLLLRPILMPVAPPAEALIVFDVPSPPAPAPEAEKPGTPEPEAAAAPPAPRKAKAGRGAPAAPSSPTARTLARRPGPFHRPSNAIRCCRHGARHGCRRNGFRHWRGRRRNWPGRWRRQGSRTLEIRPYRQARLPGGCCPREPRRAGHGASRNQCGRPRHRLHGRPLLRHPLARLHHLPPHSAAVPLRTRT